MPLPPYRETNQVRAEHGMMVTLSGGHLQAEKAIMREGDVSKERRGQSPQSANVSGAWSEHSAKSHSWEQRSSVADFPTFQEKQEIQIFDECFLIFFHWKLVFPKK